MDKVENISVSNYLPVSLSNLARLPDSLHYF